MAIFLCGLLVFLGAHSLRLVVPAWRERQIARLGAQRWRGVFSLVALVSFIVMIRGFGEVRTEPLMLWLPPVWIKHPAALLILLAFIIFAAAFVPGNRIKSLLGHPMLAAVILWAFAHLLANGRLGDLILFGAFLLWSLVQFFSLRRRDRVAGVAYPRLGLARDALTVGVGLAAYFAFVLFLHEYFFMLRPF